ncbi:hypothetical protein OEZ86_000128 [Tetradesmus obliquus]|nr:hypothetical protein OEZ86_000128 [Tetradesmus obliquus]
MGSVCVSVVLSLSLAAVHFAPAAWAASAGEWRSRTIYQVVTDRFAPSDCWGTPCSNLNGYCGGTWEGMAKRLPHITGMGFDAVWISPVMLQGGDAFGTAGYHGYWPADLYSINPAFGSEQQLQALMQKCHNSVVYVMFDMVINHMGYGNAQFFHPFNASSDFHDCNGCHGPYCDIDPAGIFAGPAAAHSSEHCKLSGLPDLNHSNPSVLSRMQHMFNHTMAAYSPDGLRLDAAGHSDTSFCAALTASVGNSTFTVVELFLVDNISLSMGAVADFVKAGGASSAFSFPMAVALSKVLREYNKHDMLWLAKRRAEHLQLMGPHVQHMLTLIENHDLPRWLHANYTLRYMNALTYVLFTEGIPVIYYGTEEGDAAQCLQDRGSFVIVLTDWGESGPQQPGQGSVVTLQGPLPVRFRGQVLRNIYNPEFELHVSAGGVGLYTADPQGAPQVFYLGHVAAPSSFFIPEDKVRRARACSP